MRNALRACAAAVLAAVPFLAQAQAAPAKPEPEFTFTGNAGLFSDYRFRGFSQTDYKPAFQGGIDFAHKSGFYAGNWNSNVEQFLYNGASLEMDFYAGYKGTAGDFGYDIGYLYYYYPGSGVAGSTKIKNGEVYVGGSYGPVSAKLFYATTNFFSLGAGTSYKTSGSYYLDLTGNFPIAEGWVLNAHAGYQDIKNGKKVGLAEDSVWDYKLGVTYDLAGWALGAAVVGTSKKDLFSTGNSLFEVAAGTRATPEGAGKTSIVLSVSKTF
jgi:uncharacterized protein (TIGR02001 family)